MKIRTIARLDLLAAAAEATLLEEITRHSAAIEQIEYQRGVLAAYKARLSETWRHGGVVHAGQARQAENFAAASEDAARKIDAEAPRAKTMLDAALQNLAAVQQRRRGLAEARRRALLAEERDLERGLERAMASRPSGRPNRHHDK